MSSAALRTLLARGVLTLTATLSWSLPFDEFARILLRMSTETEFRWRRGLCGFCYGTIEKLRHEIGTKSFLGTRDDECAFHFVQCLNQAVVENGDDENREVERMTREIDHATPRS